MSKRVKGCAFISFRWDFFFVSASRFSLFRIIQVSGNMIYVFRFLPAAASSESDPQMKELFSVEIVDWKYAKFI